MFETMLGEKPLPLPVVKADVTTTAPAAGTAAPVAPLTRDILPEKWELLWTAMPHIMVGKPEVAMITCEDALESCILYGIELGMIWPRIKTMQEKWDLDKKARVPVEHEIAL